MLVLRLSLLILQFDLLVDSNGSPRFHLIPFVRAVLSDPGEAQLHRSSQVLLSHTAYRLSPPTSQLSLGALSLKGDYPHPTAHTIPVYA